MPVPRFRVLQRFSQCLAAFPSASGFGRDDPVNLGLNLGDTAELQVEVVSEIIENPSTLVQNFNHAVELRTRHSAAVRFRNPWEWRNFSGSRRHARIGRPILRDGVSEIKTYRKSNLCVSALRPIQAQGLHSGSGQRPNRFQLLALQPVILRESACMRGRRMRP